MHRLFMHIAFMVRSRLCIDLSWFREDESVQMVFCTTNMILFQISYIGRISTRFILALSGLYHLDHMYFEFGTSRR